MSTPAFLHGILTHERPIFLRVAKAMPADQLDWRPHPKSRSAGELLGHLIGHWQDIVEVLDEGDIHHRNQVAYDSLEDGLEKLDGSCGEALDRIAKADDVSWATPARFFVGENPIAEATRGQMAWLMFLDAVHHRGQLSTYLRPMGGSCPGIYGPSADQPAGH